MNPHFLNPWKFWPGIHSLLRVINCILNLPLAAEKSRGTNQKLPGNTHIVLQYTREAVAISLHVPNLHNCILNHHAKDGHKWESGMQTDYCHAIHTIGVRRRCTSSRVFIMLTAHNLQITLRCKLTRYIEVSFTLVSPCHMCGLMRGRMRLSMMAWIHTCIHA